MLQIKIAFLSNDKLWLFVGTAPSTQREDEDRCNAAVYK